MDDYKKIVLIKEKVKRYISKDNDIDQDNNLYNLWVNDIILDKPDNDIYIHHLGIYYGYRKQNEKKMTTLLKPLVKKGNLDVIDDLALYYSDKENSDKAIKYYKILIKHGDIPSMYNLGEYYLFYVGDEERAKKYYKLAAKNDFKEAYFVLAFHYDDKNKIQKALYYYLLSGEIKLVNDFLNKILKSGVELDSYFDKCLSLLSIIKDKTRLPPVIRLLIDIYDKYNILQHDIIHYAPNFDGYIEVKNDFTNLVRGT